MQLLSRQLVICDPSSLPGGDRMGVVNAVRQGDWVLRRAEGGSIALFYGPLETALRAADGDLFALEGEVGGTFVAEPYTVKLWRAVAFTDIAAYVFTDGILGADRTAGFLQDGNPTEKLQGVAHPRLRRSFDAGYLVRTDIDQAEVRPSVLRDRDGLAVAVFLHLG